MQIKAVERVEVEHNPVAIEIFVPEDEVSYEDCYNTDARFPNRFIDPNGNLVIRVNIDTGKVHGWPDGAEVDAYFKPRDAGRYYLIAEDGKVIKARDDDYVPSCLDMNGGGGDYLALKIGPDGTVDGFKQACNSSSIVESFWKGED